MDRCSAAEEPSWMPTADALRCGERVLVVTSEVYPLAKTGGLADVCAALPAALAELGADVRLLLPGYPAALDQLESPRVLARFGPLLGIEGVRLVAGRIPDSGLEAWLVDCPSLYLRPGGIYQSSDGLEWSDNALRFGLLCEAAAALALGRVDVGWRPHIVHCNDWHTGLVPLLVKRGGATRPRSVFTLHNAAFQGNYPLAVAERLGLGAALAGPKGIEFYGQLSFLKAGLVHADRITTVSPTYAREILTPEFGCGMDGVLQARGSALSGILNGIDTRLWDPAADPLIERPYSVHAPGGKLACKRALQEQLGLAVDGQRPLAIMVNRVTRQKMADVVLASLPELLQRHPQLQFAMLGQGDQDLEQGFAEIAQAFRGRISASIGFSEPAAHRLHAGGDLLLHGSRFEPCGLTQMYAMRYGTLPVVRRIGGLADTVVDAGRDASDARVAEEANGFDFTDSSGEALMDAVGRGIDTWERRPQSWRQLKMQAMSRDFGWKHSAQRYRGLYAGLVASGRDGQRVPASPGQLTRPRLSTPAH